MKIFDIKGNNFYIHSFKCTDLFKFFYNILSFKSGQYINTAVTNSTPVNIRNAVPSKMVIIKWTGRVRKRRNMTNC